MGIFDNLFNPQGPTQAAQLQAAYSLLGQQGFGNAGMAGLQAAQQFRQQQSEQERRKLLDQLTKFQVEQAQREGQIAALPQQFATPARIDPQMDARDIGTPGAAPTIPAAFDTQGYLNALRGMDPMRAMQMEAAMQKQGPKLENVAPGAKVGYYKDGKWIDVASNPKAPDQPTSVQEYQLAVQQGYKGTFTDWLTGIKKAGASSVNVGLQNPVQALGPDGSPIYVQPANKPGAAPQVLTGPNGTPLRPPLNDAEKKAQQKIADAKEAVAVTADIRAALGTATSGFAQNLFNQGAGAIGVPTQGAMSDAKLNVLSSKLVALVPRFEGPQSDADTKMYKQAAGDLANPLLPREVRMSALDTVEALHRKAAGMTSPKRGDTNVNVDDLVNKYRSK